MICAKHLCIVHLRADIHTCPSSVGRPGVERVETNNN